MKVEFLYLVINCISARSTTQMLSIKNEYTLCCLNFLINSLCNSPTNRSFDIISLLIAPPENLGADL